MNQKYELTKLILENSKLDTSNPRIKKMIPVWWTNIRSKDKGGLRLTEVGFNALTQLDLKVYELRFDEPVEFTNELIIWLDQNIDCPFYFNNKKIWVFGERTAVQLVLFSGNISKYHRAQKKFKEKTVSS